MVTVGYGNSGSLNINRDIWNPAYKKALGYFVPLNRAGQASFAQQLLNKGVNTEIVSILLGHADGGKTLKDNYADPSVVAVWGIVEAMKKN